MMTIWLEAGVRMHPVEGEGRVRSRRVESVAITVSIGTSVHLPGQPPAVLLAAADRNLYLAKSGGRGRIVLDKPVQAEA